MLVIGKKMHSGLRRVRDRIFTFYAERRDARIERENDADRDRVTALTLEMLRVDALMDERLYYEEQNTHTAGARIRAWHNRYEEQNTHRAGARIRAWHNR
jgi:hypothetical protein